MGRDFDLRRELEPLPEVATDRLEQEIALGADVAAEDDERQVERGRERNDVQRDASRGLGDDSQPNVVAGAGGGEEVLCCERRCESGLFRLGK